MKSCVRLFVCMLFCIFCFSTYSVCAEDIREIKPYQVTRPSEVDDLFQKDIGRAFTLEFSITPTYKVTIKERGYLITRMTNEHHWGFDLYDDESCSTKNTHADKQGGWLLDPGEYYFKVSMSTAGAKSGYVYFLPASAIMKASVQINGDHAEISILIAESMNPDKVTLKYTNEVQSIETLTNYATKWNKTISDRKFTVNENGTYSVALVSTQDEWKKYYVAIDVPVQGITTEESKMSPEQSTDEKSADGKDTVDKPITEQKVNAKIEAAKKKARFGKKTVIKIFSNAGIKLTVKAKNARAKNKKFVKIKNGKTAKLTFSKKAVKGKYTFTVTSPDVGVKTITVRVK